LKNAKKVARVEKLRAIVNGEYDGLPIEDIDLEEKVKKPGRRGRPPKTAVANAEAEDAVTTKKPVKRRTKTIENIGEKRPVTKTKVLGKAASAPKTKKTALVYEDIGNSDEESELSERFDFDTDEENDALGRDLDASDAEKDAACFAAAEGSREMQINDFEDSPLSSPSSASSSPKITASPTKKRRTLSFGNIPPESHLGMHAILLQDGSTAATKTSRARPAQILEISDSD